MELYSHSQRMLCLIFIIIPTVSLQVVQSLIYNDSRTDHGSCSFRSVRQAEYNWNSPEQSMTESFVLDDVEYKLCRYHVTWDEALVFCSSNKAHLATLDSEEKTALVVQAIASISAVSEEYWIGATQMYEEPWRWNSNGMTFTSEEDIISKIPIWYPGFESNNIHCLTIDRSGHNDPIFVPRACDQRRGFICQRENDRTFDKNIRMVAANRIGQLEFRLYAGRATWAEAVVHCRQEGLQIGEVNTVEEARALAISMLRNRPEGIESVWIGGYTRKQDDDSTWRWLASGEKIENNDMWRKDLSESSGGCLLLDRHVCEIPVYVESFCDRKRDVLCQKPPKKLPSKTPVAVVVDDCPYWVGFHPLKWLDARRACETLNASLVVLDSPATISHMMSLMLDNKAELRHIWTNGRRSKTKGHWIWDVTGESIADFGKSFIPWCPDDDYYTKENSCLNLDREKLDSPLVYGLSCREKQTYVCQPYVGDCVLHSMPNLPGDAMINASEDIEEETTLKYSSTLDKYMATLSMSTITTPFSIVNLKDGVLQTTTIHSENNDLGDLMTTWKSSERIVEKNSSSQRKFTQYLKPFTRLTLPSLPQFGIKVVSATEASTDSPRRPSIDMKKEKNNPRSSPLSSTSVVTNGYSDGRKASKDEATIYHLSDYRPYMPTISSVSIESTTEESSRIVVDTSRPAFTQISPSLQSFFGSKNSLKSSKASKISVTSSSVVSIDHSSDPSSAELDRTIKYSMKTTRDLNYSDNATTKAPEVPNIPNEQIIKSDSAPASQNLSPKSIGGSLVAKKLARPDSKFVPKKRPNVRVTTQIATPYDAIDMEYYNDDKYDKSTKKSVLGNSKKSGESIEYSEDYESTSRAKLLPKKKSKHTSTVSKTLGDEEEVEEDEEEEEEEESGEEDKDAVKSSLPIVAELSKNLGSALVTMMKNGLEKKNSEKSGGFSRSMKIDEKPINRENAVKSLSDEDSEIGLKSVKVEHITFRPYYAFEGPLIADLPEVMKREGGDAREFTFIGNKLTPEGFDDVKKSQNQLSNELSNLLINETLRRSDNSQPPSNPQNRQNNFPISMVGMPPINPNDPNSMMQLGRYFKTQFSGLQRGSHRNVEDRSRPAPMPASSREETEVNNQRRFGPAERPFLQERLGAGYPVRTGEQVITNKGQQWNKPLKTPGSGESVTNYNAGPGRRLYPRGNYDISGSSPEQKRINNGVRLRNADREKLDVAWPHKYRVHYDNFDQPGQSVSSRSSPVAKRTTRSFHEDPRARTNETIELKPFPDFKLSKLVKEVKIDLNQRMLRRYLERFTDKYGTKTPGAENHHWKDTWRLLLRQMLSMIDRMNINVNGNLMKLRVGSEDIDKKLSAPLENSREMRGNWAGLVGGNGKQRKDSASRNDAKLVKKMNETLRVNSTVKNRQKLMRAPLNNLHIKDSAKMNAKSEAEGTTAANYGKIDESRDTITRGSLEKEEVKATTFPGLEIDNITFGDNLSKHRQERTDKPIVDHRENSHKMPTENVLKPEYTNFTNTIIDRRPESIIAGAELSTDSSYRPALMPQLHHRNIFQPDIRAKSGPQNIVYLQGEYSPKEALSKMINNENKNEDFEGKKLEYNFLVSTSSTAKPEQSYLKSSVKNSVEKKTRPKSVDERKIDKENNNVASKVVLVSEISEINSNARQKSNEVGTERHKAPGTDNNVNERWRDVSEEIARNKLRNLDGYYNATDESEEFNDREIDDSKEESHRDMEEEIVDEETEAPEDYEGKRMWTPAHRLNKALELSMLRKFAVNPSNSMRLKNLVTRSVKEIRAIGAAKTAETASRNSNYIQGQKIEKSLENLKDEPSVISLRMIMDPERKSSRIFRQSQDRRALAKNPQTVELRVQFSGKEEPTTAITEKNNSRNNLTQNGKIKQTFHGSSERSDSGRNFKDKNFKSLVDIKRPLRFVDKEQAMLNRLRQRNSNFKRNYLRAAAKRRQNQTAINDFRNRRYRNIGLANKNGLSEGKAVKEIPNAKHYIATSLRSLDEKNLTNSAANMSKKGGKSREKDLSIDWAKQASAVIADLKKSNDDLTLYIDLSLGRVGSKSPIRARSKG